MDPLSVIASVIGIATGVIATADQIKTFRGKLKHAPRDIEHVKKDIIIHKDFLVRLHTHISNPGSSANRQAFAAASQAWDLDHHQAVLQHLQDRLNALRPTRRHSLFGKLADLYSNRRWLSTYADLVQDLDRIRQFRDAVHPIFTIQTL